MTWFPLYPFNISSPKFIALHQGNYIKEAISKDAYNFIVDLLFMNEVYGTHLTSRCTCNDQKERKTIHK